MKKILLTLIFALVTVSITVAQKVSKEEKREQKLAIEEAVSYAGSIAITHTDTEKLLQSNFHLRAFMKTIKHRPAFISYVGDGTGYDAKMPIKNLLGKPEWFPLLYEKIRALYDTGIHATYATILLGNQTFLVPKNGATVEVLNDGRRRYELDTLRVNLEEGRFYSILSKVDKDNKIEFSFFETDPTSYEAYQAANPNRLDGTWSGGSKAFNKKYETRYTFSGDRLTIEGESTYIPRKSYSARGKVFFNENSIIFFHEEIMDNGKEFDKFGVVPIVWHYTIDGNELRIDPISPSPVGWINGGVCSRVE